MRLVSFLSLLLSMLHVLPLPVDRQRDYALYRPTDEWLLNARTQNLQFEFVILRFRRARAHARPRDCKMRFVHDLTTPFHPQPCQHK